MSSSVVSSRVENRAVLSPNRPGGSFPGVAMQVRSRRVADILEFPTYVHHVWFHEVVVVTVEVGGNQQVVETQGFNVTQPFTITRCEQEATRLISSGWQLVPIHPDLEGALWVLGKLDISEQLETSPQFPLPAVSARS